MLIQAGLTPEGRHIGVVLIQASSGRTKCFLWIQADLSHFRRIQQCCPSNEELAMQGEVLNPLLLYVECGHFTHGSANYSQHMMPSHPLCSCNVSCHLVDICFNSSPDACLEK